MNDTCECIIDEDRDGCFGYLAHVRGDGNRAEVQTEWYETRKEVLNAVGWFASHLRWKVPDRIEDRTAGKRNRRTATGASLSELMARVADLPQETDSMSPP